MSEAADSKPGVWSSLKRILDTLLAAAQNRIELFLVELEEEKCRMVETLICLAAVVAFGMMALTLITFAIVIVFWDSWRLTAVGTLTGLYLVAAGLSWRAMRARLNNRNAFTGTLEELRKDRSCLRTDQ